MKALQEGCGNTLRYKRAHVVNYVGWISAIYCEGKAVLTWMMSVLRVSSLPWYAASWRGVLSDQESEVNKDRQTIKLNWSHLTILYSNSQNVTLYFQSHSETFYLKRTHTHFTNYSCKTLLKNKEKRGECVREKERTYQPSESYKSVPHRCKKASAKTVRTVKAQFVQQPWWKWNSRTLEEV